VGYGDVTPGSRVARSLSVVEALFGQFYVAVVLAALIGLVVAQAISDRPPTPPRGGR
jgi:hypothetical protein